MLKMELPGKRKRGRPKRRYMDAAREWLDWRRRMQKIGPNGDVKSDVPNIAGRSRTKKKNTKI